MKGNVIFISVSDTEDTREYLDDDEVLGPASEFEKVGEEGRTSLLNCIGLGWRWERALAVGDRRR